MGLLRSPDLAALAEAPLTYPGVGSARLGTAPPGFRAVRRSAVVGSGRAAFERASAAVLDWRAQRTAGLRVRASGPAGTPGTVVVLTAGFPRFGYDIPCRVVWARTDGDERGFAYGTLPGHPESGEECFLVRLTPEDDVVYEIRVFFRLASPGARLAGPLALLLQRAATEVYVASIRRAVQVGRTSKRPPRTQRHHAPHARAARAFRTAVVGTRNSVRMHTAPLLSARAGQGRPDQPLLTDQQGS